MSDTFEAHVAPGDLALYVIDALAPGRRDAVESHVFACEGCASLLAREACLEAALEEVAYRANRVAEERRMAPVLSIVPALRAAAATRGDAREARSTRGPARSTAAEARAARVASIPARRSRWAGGIAGTLAAAAALVLAFASSRSEAAGVAQRSATFGDAAGDMSGARVSESLVGDVRSDSLDGG
jgi:hypothetical protein